MNLSSQSAAEPECSERAALGAVVRSLPLQDRLGGLARRLFTDDEAGWLAPYRLHGAVDASPPAAGGGQEPEPLPQADRAAVAAALLDRNRAWGHPTAKERSQRLADPECQLVVTGQQAGFLGGPQLTLSKLLAAVAFARQIEQQTGRPAEAVFWIASDDHDFDEVAKAFLPLGSCGPEVSAGKDAMPQVPVSARTVGATACAAVRAFVDGLGDQDRDELEGSLRLWCEGTPWVDAFAEMLIRRLGEHCPLLLDAADPALKRLQMPALRRLVERAEEVDAALGEREGQIEAEGLSPQVRPQPSWLPLFAHRHSCRHRMGLERGGDGELRHPLRGSDEVWTHQELLTEVDAHPERFSPTALARPAFQDQLLGTTLFVVGPGEFSYLAQASVIHRQLGVPAPQVALRPQYLIVDERRAGQIEELGRAGLDLATLIGGEPAIEQHLAAAGRGDRSADDPSTQLEQVEEQLRNAAARLRQAAAATDPGLEKPGAKTADQIERALDNFDKRLQALMARRDEQLHQRIASLREALLPGGVLQERRVGWLALERWNAAAVEGAGADNFADLLLRDLPLGPSLHLLVPGRITQGESA